MLLIAVTVLTSMDQPDLQQSWVYLTARAEQVLHLARLAKSSWLAGSRLFRSGGQCVKG